MWYSIEPRHRIYEKSSGFFCLLLKAGANLSNKYGQKLFDSAQKSTTVAMKTASKRAIQKTVVATGDLIGNKIVDKITRVSYGIALKKWGWNRNIKRKIYISRKRATNYWWIKISNNNTIMEYQKIINLLDITSNQLSKFRIKYWVEMND